MNITKAPTAKDPDRLVVHMTEKEKEVISLHAQIMSEGHEIAPAAEYALSVLPDPDPRFALFLSGGTLAQINGIIEQVSPFGVDQ